MYRLDTSKRYVGRAPMASGDSAAVVRRRLPRRHAGAGPAMRPRPVVGYGPAKRTTLAELRSGSPTRDDACDAHPCPLRAAGCHGEPAGGPGPVRRREPLAHVTYVHGDAPGSRRRTRQVGGRAGRDGPRIRRIQGLCGGSVSKLRMEPPGDVVRPRPRGAGPAR
ncbi:DUF5318 family protein [Actinomadura hallensis]|uniref:DUF5318 family protein n=1 Tax=Actinomadura hallensis TaxID=337895 RepID=UPI003CCC85F4